MLFKVIAARLCLTQKLLSFSRNSAVSMLFVLYRPEEENIVSITIINIVMSNPTNGREAD